jgi:O-antigen ligase
VFRAPTQHRHEKVLFALLGLLAAWMVLPLIPLPPALVGYLSPDRYSAAMAARAATGANSGAWIALSFAPAATMERLLDVLPAIAALLAAQEIGRRWKDRIWLAAIPVLLAAWIESVIGLAQFYAMRASGLEVTAVTGTYVNRNHFAGLLEMAFPVAAMAAVAALEDRRRVQVTAWAGVAPCLLLGIVMSLSRMGFAATLCAVGFIGLLFVVARHRRLAVWRWAIPLAAPVCILLLLPTKELKQRFAYMAASEDVNTDTRVAIWRDTMQLIASQKWTGTGPGAYERGLYRFKTAKPVNTVDFAHNDYLQLLAELGIPGCILLAALAGWIIRRPLNVALRNRRSPYWAFAVGLLGAFLAIGFHSLTDFNLYIPANLLALAWLAGLALSLPGEGTSRAAV